MNVWRYQTYRQIEIDAPIDQVYATIHGRDAHATV
jgi:hypothetical protein